MSAKKPAPDKRQVVLEWTGNPDADGLVASDPTALLIGFCLDQQIPIEKAFSGPLVMVERFGTLDAAELARVDPEVFAEKFRKVPALHRFPGSMAARVQGLCEIIATTYNGDAARIWTEAADARDLQKRLMELPGFGRQKAAIVVGVIVKRLGVALDGWQDVVPTQPSLADVSTLEERRAYQTQKRAYKAQLREAAATPASKKPVSKKPRTGAATRPRAT